MAVSLRVVGNFYNQTDIPFDPKTTIEGTTFMSVKDVLDAASENPAPGASKFGYIAATSSVQNSTPSVTAFYANYDAPFKSPTSLLDYPAGEYFVTESLVDNPLYSVWQYYVFDAPLDAGGARYLRRPDPNIGGTSSRIQSFAEAGVPDGGQVVWRLVTVLSGRNPLPAVYRPIFEAAQPAEIAPSV